MKTEATQDRLNNRTHQHSTLWFVGTGAQTEFFLTTVSIGQLDDIEVFVGGALKRPADASAARDYKVRGLSPGYAGEQSAIKFTAAPANGADIGVRLVAT